MSKLAEIIEAYINGNITIAKKQFLNFDNRVISVQIIECTELVGIRVTIKIVKNIGYISPIE